MDYESLIQSRGVVSRRAAIGSTNHQRPFPIDGLGYGNQGNSHNYHFTLALNSEFTFQPGQTFNFTGDDDVWVFINNQLALDVGGVHDPLSGSVNLNTLGLTPGNT